MIVNELFSYESAVEVDSMREAREKFSPLALNF